MKVTEHQVQRYMEYLKGKYPGLRILHKKPWWLRVVFGLPFIRTLHWEESTQTIGNMIALSTVWDTFSPEAKMSTLRHEDKHEAQFRKYGVVLMSFLYLFVFPFRALFEREGFAESLKARVEYRGPTEAVRRAGLELYLRVFAGKMYLWMMPFKSVVRRWFNEDWAKATSKR